MILDELLEFADATALNTGAAGTYNVGDIIDIGANRDDIGGGEPMYLVIQVSTTATSGGSATGQFKLVSDATSTISTTTATVHSITAPIAVASLVAGYQLVIPLPPAPDVVYERYIALQQVTGTAAFTAGNVNAFITSEPTTWRATPDATN